MGVWLRWVPCSTDPEGVAFRFDRAYHLRMTMEVLKQDQVPPVDMLRYHPHGAHLDRQLPSGLYHITAWSHRLLELCTDVSPEHSVLMMCALFGALICVPVFRICIQMGGHPLAGLCAAFLAASLPAHLHRSSGYWFRYEGLGTTFLCCFLSSFLSARGAPTLFRRAVWALAAMFFACVSLWVWRAAAPFLALTSLWAAVATLRRPTATSTAFVGAGVNATVLLSTALPAPFSTPPLSTIYWIVFGCSGLLCTWILIRKPTESLRRLWCLGGCAGLLGLGAVGHAGWNATSGSPGSMAAKRLISVLTGYEPTYTFVEAMYQRNEELQMAMPWLWAAPGYFSLSLVLVAAYVMLRFIVLRADLAHNVSASCESLLWLVAGAMAVSTLVFDRSKILLAPFVAITAGLGAGLMPAALAKPAWCQRWSLHQRFAAGACFTGAILCVTAFDGYHLMASRDTKTTVQEQRALDWIREHTRPGEGVLSFWSLGYAIQTYTHRPTVMDGMLEAHANRQAMEAFSDALYDEEEAMLTSFCREYDVTWLLLPLNRKADLAAMAGRRYSDYFDDNRPTNKGHATVLAKLIYEPASLQTLSLAAQLPGSHIFRFDDNRSNRHER